MAPPLDRSKLPLRRITASAALSEFGLVIGLGLSIALSPGDQDGFAEQLGELADQDGQESAVPGAVADRLGEEFVPVILDFCKDIREVGEPGAKFLNYANPMAMNTWAAIEYGKVETIGLCHGVQHGGGRSPRRSAPSPHSELDYLLLRHQPPDLVRRSALQRPQDRQGRAGRRLRARIRSIRSRRRCAIDVLKRFGFYSTESRTATCPNTCPGTASGRTRSPRWIDMSDWIHGETGGYLRYSTESRNWFETDFPQVPRGGGEADRPSTSAPTSTPATSSRRWRPAASIAATSTSRTTASSPICPQTAIIEIARLRRPLRHQHGRRHHAARSLCRDLHRLDQRAAHVGACRR